MAALTLSLSERCWVKPMLSPESKATPRNSSDTAVIGNSVSRFIVFLLWSPFQHDESLWERTASVPARPEHRIASCSKWKIHVSGYLTHSHSEGDGTF